MNNLEKIAAEAMEKARKAKEAADQARAKEKAEKARKEVSSKAVARTLERYVDDRLLRGTLTPQLVRAYIETQSRPVWSYLELSYRLLADPVYGLHRGPLGEFIYQGKTFKSPRDIQLALESYLGDPPASVDYIDAFMRDVLVGGNDNPGGSVIWDVAHQENNLAIPDEELTLEDNMKLRAALGMDPLGETRPREGLQAVLDGETPEPAGDSQ